MEVLINKDKHAFVKASLTKATLEDVGNGTYILSHRSFKQILKKSDAEKIINDQEKPKPQSKPKVRPRIKTMEFK